MVSRIIGEGDVLGTGNFSSYIPKPYGGAQQTTQKKKKNFWEDQISTGGSLGGALAGGAAGTAILPGVGTLIGALLGGAAGGFGGQVAENKITGEQDLFKDAGTEALWGGATALPFGAGLKLAKAGGTLAKGLGSDAARTTAKSLVQEAGLKTIGQKQLQNLTLKDALAPETKAAAENLATQIPGSAPLKNSLQGKLKNFSDNALMSQYGTISKPVARANSPAQTFGSLADFGLIKPLDVERTAAAVTGSSGAINKAVLRATGRSNGVDTSGLKRVLEDALDNYGVVDKDRKSIASFFDAKMKMLNGGARGSISATSNPSDTLGFMKALEKRIADLDGKGSNYKLSTPERADMANSLRLLKDEVQDRLYKGAGADKQLPSVLNDKFKQEMLKINPNNKKWATFVDDKVMGAKSIGELRSTMAPFVRANNIIDEADINAMTFGGRAGGSGIKDVLMEKATALVANPARQVASKVAGTISSKLPSSSAQQLQGQSLKSALTRIGGVNAVRSLVDDQALNQLDNRSSTTNNITPSTYSATTASTMPNAISNMDSQYSQDPQVSSEPSIGGYSKSQIENAMAAAIMDGNSKAFGQLQSLYELLPKGSELSATAGTQVASKANATNTLCQLEGLYGTSGGGLGKIGGSLQNALAGAGLNGDVQTYNDLAASSVSQLARALNGGGQVSDADAAVVIQALPKVTDSPEVAARKFAALKDRLQNAMQNTLTYSGGADSSQQTALQ